MGNKSAFILEWIRVGEHLANGGHLDISIPLSVYDNLNLSKWNSNFLPKENTVVGSPTSRKIAIFDLAEKIWGKKPEEWLEMESRWLAQAREISGSSETKGKDCLDDVVSAELLLRFVATAILTKEATTQSIAVEAVNALDLAIQEACSKGRTRMQRVCNRSIYGHLRQGGLMIGTGGGKFLPYPKKALPALLLMLQKSKIKPAVFKESL